MEVIADREKLYNLQKTVDDKVQDTVGVVVLDRTGRVAGTVSSGGIALKQPGRVGQVRSSDVRTRMLKPLYRIVRPAALVVGVGLRNLWRTPHIVLLSAPQVREGRGEI